MQFSSDNCQGVSLDQGTACTVTVSLDATRNGDYSSVLRAKSGDTSIGNTTLQGLVTAQVPPVWSVSSGILQLGVMGTDFSFTAQVTDQNGDMLPAGITIISGSIPQGLNINLGVNSSGLREMYITGIPGEVGTFTTTARIEDEAGHVVDQVITMEIFPPISNLVLTGNDTFNLSASVPEVINTFTFRNESPDTTAPVGAVLTPPSQTRFTIINDQCNGIRLAAFEQCTMQVRAVRDGAPGVYTASLISGGGIYGSDSINRTLTINQN